MKMLRILLVIGLVCGLTHRATADDFQMIVVDPLPSYQVFQITNTSFDFFFIAPCISPGQIPSGANYDACFTGQNETGSVLTSLTIAVANNIGNQTAGCSPSGLNNQQGQPIDIFSTISCGPGPGGVGYLLTYSGGNIPTGGIFTIAEQGATPADFGDVHAAAGTAAATPEPGSLILLSTGMLSAGSYLFGGRRRRAASLS
ncbi:MAG: hypothetical protein NVSMB62_15460 [Acidobacteriaceae bacterium]